MGICSSARLFCLNYSVHKLNRRNRNRDRRTIVERVKRQCSKSITHVSPWLPHWQGGCQLVADLLVTRPTSLQQVVAMECGEMTRLNRHNGRLPMPTCYRLVVYVADLLWTWGSGQLVTDLLRGNWCNGFGPYIRPIRFWDLIRIRIIIPNSILDSIQMQTADSQVPSI